MSIKNEGESVNSIEKITKNHEVTYTSSVRNVCIMSSSNSVQEVPCPICFGNSIENQEIMLQANHKEDYTAYEEHVKSCNNSSPNGKKNKGKKCSNEPGVKKLAQSKNVSLTPKPKPGSSRRLVSPIKDQYKNVKSPVGQYIRTGKVIKTAKSLPALYSPNK